MSTRDGGPAFPVPASAVGQDGDFACLSIRDYFIAHAPTEPQPWFVPTMLSPKPLPKWVSDDGEWIFPHASAASAKCGDDFHDANRQAQLEWDAEHERQRLLQWPCAWADAMLAERAKVRP